MISTGSASPTEVTTLVVRLARFAIVCTVAIGPVLLVMDVLTNTVGSRAGSLTERTTITLLCAIVAAVAALVCLALWKR